MRTLLVAGAFLLVLSRFANAEEPLVFGDWMVSFTPGQMFYAATINDAGSVLGKYCYTKSETCFFLIGMRTRCEQGNSYTTLANSEAGSQVFEIFCNGQLDSGMFQYAFKDFAAINEYVQKSPRVGFAIPMHDDEFRVIRFSARGAAKAIDTVNRFAARLYGGEKKESGSYRPSEEDL